MALKDLMNRGERVEPAEVVESKPETKAATAPAPKPAAPSRPSSAPATVLDATTRFEGVIRCEGSIRIDGDVDGEIHAEQSVIVGKPATLRAAIEADQAVIAGVVEGDITAIRKITLEETARVTGNLRTPGIVIQEGAVLEGRIMIGAEAGAPAKREAPEKARTSGEESKPARTASSSDPPGRPPSAGSPPPSS